MPSRWMSLAILLFWLSSTGWLFWREVWPDWRGGEPPPFHIDLVEEVRKSTFMKTNWIVKHNDQNVFKAYTWIAYEQKSDTFELNSRYSREGSNLKPFKLARFFQVESMSSQYRVNRAGQLQSLQAELHVALKELHHSEKLTISLQGEVRQGQFFAHCRGGIGPEDRSVEINLPPAAVSENGSVLMPLHPVNRIHGLRPGQGWRQPLIDPFRDAFASVPGFSAGARCVNAYVLPQAQYLKEADASCLVIEYEDEGKVIGRTWVEQNSELVVRQEAFLDDGHWIMQREGILSKTW